MFFVYPYCKVKKNRQDVIQLNRVNMKFKKSIRFYLGVVAKIANFVSNQHPQKRHTRYKPFD